MVRPGVIETPLNAWEALVLPLNYGRSIVPRKYLIINHLFKNIFSFLTSESD